MIRVVTRATLHCLLAMLVFTAVFISGLRLFLAEIHSYKQYLTSAISETLPVPINIGSLRASLRGLKPEIVLKDLSIVGANSDAATIHVRELHLDISLIDLISQRQLYIPQTLTVVGANLTIQRDDQGSISILGLPEQKKQSFWFLRGQNYQLLDSEITWLDLQHNQEAVTFSHVNVFLANFPDSNTHQLNLDLQLPETWGRHLTLISQFSSEQLDLKDLSGEVYIKGQALQLETLGAYTANQPYQLSGGIADAELWSDWDSNKLKQLSGKVAILNGRINNLETDADLAWDKLDSVFTLRREPGNLQLGLERLHINSGEQSTEHRDIYLTLLQDPENNLQSVAASAEQLQLGHLPQLTQFLQFANTELNERIQKLVVSGEMRDFKLYFENQQKLALYTQVESLTMQAIQGFPSVQRISGFIRGGLEQGEMYLHSQDAQLQFPDVFPHALTLKNLHGKVAWRQEQNNTQISSQLLELDTPDFKTRNRFQLIIPEDGQDYFLDWQNEFGHIQDMAAISRYLPAKIMDPVDVNWIQRFFVAGQVDQGRGQFYGNIADFPFDSGNGILEVLFEAQDAELFFDPEWSRLTQVYASVLFLNKSLTVQGHHGQVHGTEILWADIYLSDLGNCDYLQVIGETSGSIEKALEFVLSSPLAERVQPVLENITPTGLANIAVSLAVPLVDEVEAETHIIVNIEEAEVRLVANDILIKELNGALEISEEQIFSDRLEGKMLGFPLNLQVNTYDQLTHIQAAGKADVESLSQYFPSPWWQYAKGATGFLLQLHIPDSGQQATQLLLTSDLQGVELLPPLPASLIKQAAQQRYLDLQFEFNESPLMPVKVNYSNTLKMALNYHAQNMQLDSANILFGKGDVDFPLNSEINLQVHSPTFDINAWNDFFQSFSRHADPEMNSKLNTVDLQTTQLRWQQQELGRLSLRVFKGADFWKIHSISPYLKGNLSIPILANKPGKVAFNLDYLNLSAIKKLDFKSHFDTPMMPEQIPELKLTSRQILWNTENLGSLTVETEKNQRGINIKRLDLIGNDKKLSAKGRWVLENGHSRTYFTGILDIDNFGDFLSQLDISRSIKNSEAFFDYQLFWSGAPHQFSLEKVQGEVRADIDKGQLLGVEPGIGRALGLLDFWQLDRRLKLDFSDLYSEGFAYNRIYGSFLLEDGQAVTEDVVVEGLAAVIEVKGRAGLVTKDIDQIVTVLPKSSVVVPIAGTIIGRVADYIQQSWTGEKHVGGFFNSSQYALKGSWSDIEVTPLYENDGLLQKMWKGITDITLTK